MLADRAVADNEVAKTVRNKYFLCYIYPAIISSLDTHRGGGEEHCSFSCGKTEVFNRYESATEDVLMAKSEHSLCRRQ